MRVESEMAKQDKHLYMTPTPADVYKYGNDDPKQDVHEPEC